MNKWISDIISALLIFLWAYAACSKLLQYDSFRGQLAASPFVGRFAGIIAAMLPVIELGAALMLTAKGTRIAGLYISFALLLIFTLYIAAMLLSGSHLPCTCGGVIQSLSWKQHLAMNILFIMLADTGIVWERKQRSLGHYHKVA